MSPSIRARAGAGIVPTVLVLASAASAASGGDAVGALLGGLAIGRWGLAAAVVTGTVLAAAAVTVSLATHRLHPAPSRAEGVPASPALAA